MSVDNLEHSLENIRYYLHDNKGKLLLLYAGGRKSGHRLWCASQEDRTWKRVEGQEERY